MKKIIIMMLALLLVPLLGQAVPCLVCQLNAEIPSLTSETRNLDPKVVKLAMKAYSCAQSIGIGHPGILTIIDFSLPSTDKRLWVIDLKTKTIVLNTLVAHGEKTGGLYAKYFSDVSGTHESSVGLYLTGPTFYANDGYSLRLYGLDKGFNDMAYKRDIVIHGAWYVSEAFIKRYGRLGRSWGCPAVPKNEIDPLINRIKDGTLLFAYFPEKKWLAKSKFLHCPIHDSDLALFKADFDKKKAEIEAHIAEERKTEDAMSVAKPKHKKPDTQSKPVKQVKPPAKPA